MNYLKQKNNIIWILLLIGVFLITRFSLVSMMYHQDEYKWAMIVDPVFHEDLKSDHPPLIGLLYKATGAIVGYDHLRLLPILVSLFNLTLLFLLVLKFYGKREAYFTSAIYTLGVYSLVANTQIDIDGALLPATMLVSFYSYMAFLKGYRREFWLPVLIGSFVLGFLIKLSFIIVIGAIATDYFLKNKIDLGLVKKISVYFFGGVLFLAALTYIFVFIFKITNPLQFILNVTHFGVFNFGERNYFQLLFLTIKSVILASPIVLLASSLVFSKRFRYDLQIWFIYLAYNIIFYYFIFDFSNRTIERYDMFLIIPSAVIGGIFLAERIRNKLVATKDKAMTVLVAAISIMTTIFVASVKSLPLPLNPKSVYIDKVKALDFNFLIPITGGSGPIGFYVSVLFVVFMFSTCSLLLFWYYKVSNRKYTTYILVAFMSFCLSYNFVLEKELIFGSTYGSVNDVTKDVVLKVNQDQNIKQVITYYDIAGYELNSTGKYFKRFYTDPMFSNTNINKFTDYKGYYMVVDFPQIDKNSVYWRYLESCEKTFETSDVGVLGYIFDCRNGDASLFK
jgi:Dolichyl-phosphate-mannose-protein mannosyltransferase